MNVSMSPDLARAFGAVQTNIAWAPAGFVLILAGEVVDLQRPFLWKIQPGAQDR
jgi:hypothetical protein